MAADNKFELEPLPKYSDDPNEYRKAWIKRKRRNDPEFARQQIVAARRWQSANPIRYSRSQYKKGARNRGFVWMLSDDLFETLVGGSCHYCGFVASAPAINGVDRLDNARGYEPDNVVTACGHCNLAKRDRPVAEFLGWVDRVANYQRTN